MSNKLFLDDIHVVSQSVRRISLSDDTFLIKEFDFNTSNLDFEIYFHKENKSEHLIVLKFGLEKFQIIVEGIYQLKRDNYKKEDKDVIINFGSMALLIDFLKTSVFTITSLTRGEPLHFPLINLKELINQKKDQIEKNKLKKDKQNTGSRNQPKTKKKS
ncbi:hypothetical protein [Gaetbulibacter jejuensis]|uniref:Preprotein translocase subunit SecB n=1 Tax=Gaetbulibacter jejuensis TaxID=584607 RepID=A0ABN1JCT3_9FLAO